MKQRIWQATVDEPKVVDEHVVDDFIEENHTLGQAISMNCDGIGAYQPSTATSTSTSIFAYKYQYAVE